MEPICTSSPGIVIATDAYLHNKPCFKRFKQDIISSLWQTRYGLATLFAAWVHACLSCAFSRHRKVGPSDCTGPCRIAGDFRLVSRDKLDRHRHITFSHAHLQGYTGQMYMCVKVFFSGVELTLV